MFHFLFLSLFILSFSGHGVNLKRFGGKVGFWLGKVTAYFADTGALRTVIQESDLPVSTAYYILSQQLMSELSWALLMIEGVILHGLLG